MQPPMDFHPFTTDKSWYNSQWLVPVPSERPTRTDRLTRIIRFLVRARPPTRRSERMPAGSLVTGAPAAQSLAIHT